MCVCVFFYHNVYRIFVNGRFFRSRQIDSFVQYVQRHLRSTFYFMTSMRNRHRVADGTKHFLSFHGAPSEFNKTLAWHTYASERQKCRGLNVFEWAYKPTADILWNWKFYWNLIDQSVNQFFFYKIVMIFQILLSYKKKL